MRFNLVDRILEVQPGKVLRAVKNLTLGEEYLADHFPSFPVMPGVLMLETLVEAGPRLARPTHHFAGSQSSVRGGRHPKYRTLLQSDPHINISVSLLAHAESAPS